jgi:hypothetical protein
MKCIHCEAKGAQPTGYNKIVNYSPVKSEAQYICLSCNEKFYKSDKKEIKKED